MGTTWSARVNAADRSSEKHTDLRQKQLEEALARVNRVMSTYDPHSDISRFNQAPAETIVGVDPSLLVVLDIARQVHRDSGGAFDPTVGPLVELWGFGSRTPTSQAPSPEEQAAGLDLVDLPSIRTIDGQNALTKVRDGLQLDFSAVAKGYGVDRAAQALLELGYEDFLVEVGGEVVVRGERSGGGPWRLIVEDPSGGPNQVRLILSDCALATSGDYRNWRRLDDGTKVAHTFDPRTGGPLLTQMASASVIAPTCALADAWATALMVLGEEGLALIEQQPGIEALLQLRDGSQLRRLRSSGWAKLEASPSK
ncbi:MAG: thiamine biosynthesis lipoprotein [Planctomycetota bacterium]|jgi:thiamine biosynthesis lipoprotein